MAPPRAALAWGICGLGIGFAAGSSIPRGPPESPGARVERPRPPASASDPDPAERVPRERASTVVGSTASAEVAAAKWEVAAIPQRHVVDRARHGSPPPPPVDRAQARARWGHWADASLDEIFAHLERAASGEKGLHLSNVIAALLARFPEVRVSPELTIRLCDAGHAHVLEKLLPTWTREERIAYAWTLSESRSPAEARRLWAVLGGLGQVDPALVDRLLASPHPTARGLGAVHAHPGSAEAVVRLAESDPDDGVRAQALAALFHNEALRDSQEHVERARAVVRRALVEGPLQLQREAVAQLEGMGAEGADLALAALARGGVGLDGGELGMLVVAVIAEGRVGELVRLHGDDPDVMAAVVRARGEFDLGALVPHVAALARVLPESAMEDLLESLAEEGQRDALLTLAVDSSLPASLRLCAIGHLGYAGAEACRALLGDASAPTAVRVAALGELANLAHEPPLRGLAQAEARWLLGAAEVPAELRRAVVTRIDAFFDGQVPAERAEVVALLERVARDDPNPWVRSQAAERIGGFREE